MPHSIRGGSRSYIAVLVVYYTQPANLDERDEAAMSEQQKMIERLNRLSDEVKRMEARIKRHQARIASELRKMNKSVLRPKN